tara:strand:- start:63675 stop:64211 length:537 start_codon:yes stop_codon:yes gene_type:complete
MYSCKFIINQIVLKFIILLFPFVAFSQTSQDYYEKAEKYYNNQDFESAIYNYTKCLTKDPNYASAYFYRARSFSFLENYSEAIKDFNIFIEIENNDATMGYHYRGYCFYQLNNFNDAIYDFTRVIILDPKNGEAYVARGICKKFSEEKYDTPYCEDFKKGCFLGINEACEWYEEECIN